MLKSCAPIALLGALGVLVAGCPPAGPPDRDGDGIEDSRDACPGAPGPKDTAGCARLTVNAALRAINISFRYGAKTPYRWHLDRKQNVLVAIQEKRPVDCRITFPLVDDLTVEHRPPRPGFNLSGMRWRHRLLLSYPEADVKYSGCAAARQRALGFDMDAAAARTGKMFQFIVAKAGAPAPRRWEGDQLLHVVGPKVYPANLRRFHAYYGLNKSNGFKNLDRGIGRSPKDKVLRIAVQIFDGRLPFDIKKTTTRARLEKRFGRKDLDLVTGDDAGSADGFDTIIRGYPVHFRFQRGKLAFMAILRQRSKGRPKPVDSGNLESAIARVKAASAKAGWRLVSEKPLAVRTKVAGLLDFSPRKGRQYQAVLIYECRFCAKTPARYVIHYPGSRKLPKTVTGDRMREKWYVIDRIGLRMKKPRPVRVDWDPRTHDGSELRQKRAAPVRLLLFERDTPR